MDPPVVLRPRAGSVAAPSATAFSAAPSTAGSSAAAPSVSVLNPAPRFDALPSLAHSDTEESDAGSETAALNPIPRPSSRAPFEGSTLSEVLSTATPPYPDAAFPPLLSANPKPLTGGAFLGNPADAAVDAQNMRPGRQSAGWNEKGWEKVTSPDMVKFLGELFDLTHAIDAAENDIDQIVALRNKIVKLKPHLDVADLSQPDVEPDLHALAGMTTKLGRDILNLETWLVQLDAHNTHLRSRVKKGDDTVDVTLDEMREIKFNLSSAKLDFADAMERIREGAFKERERRERSRVWLAKYIRAREPDVSDADVESLLKASELGAADGVEENEPTSYAGLWALRNPFTEVAELTNGMAFTGELTPLDAEIIKAVVPSSHPDDDDTYRQTGPALASSRVAWLTQARWSPRPAPGAANKKAKDALELAEEKDMEFGYARQKQKQRAASRRRMIVALLVVLIVALVILVLVSTLAVSDDLLAGAGSW